MDQARREISPSRSFDPAGYWEDRLAAEYDLAGVGRRSFGVHYNRWAYRIRRHVFLNTLRRIGRDWSKAGVLDIGAGTGFYVDRWLELGAASITGLDLTETAVAGLTAKYPDQTFLRADIGQGVGLLVDRQFDAVSCMDVLLHIVDDGRFASAIANVHRLLKPDGIFVFSDPMVRGSERRLGHVAHRSRQSIEETLAQTGFELLHRGPMFVLMDEPVDSRSLLLRGHWWLLRSGLFVANWLGIVLGAALFPVESALLAVLREGPSTKIAVYRRSA